VIGQPAAPLAEHLELAGLLLGATRRVEEGDYRHAFVFSLLADGHAVSSKEMTHVFPLRLKGAFGESTDNWKPEFKKFIKKKYGKEPSPEELFGYIYAILNSPVYRDKFEDFLADDYPRVPFPNEHKNFQALSGLGWELVQAHILKNVPSLGRAKFKGKGTNCVEALRYLVEGEAIYINDTQRFHPVSADVWNFQIGTYRVMERFLKARAERELTLDEIDRVTDMANVLAFSINQMAKIDSAYKKTFPA